MTHEQLDLWVAENWDQKVDTKLGAESGRPVNSPRPTIYFATDTNEVSFWGEGPSWIDVGTSSTSTSGPVVYPYWNDTTDWQIGDKIINDNQIYLCVVQGTQSTDFATNFTANSWIYSNPDVVDPNGKTALKMTPDPLISGEYLIDAQHSDKSSISHEGFFYRDKQQTDSWGNPLVCTVGRDAVTEGSFVIGNSFDQNITVSNGRDSFKHFHTNMLFPEKIEETVMTVTTPGEDYFGVFDDGSVQRVYSFGLEVIDTSADMRLTYYLDDGAGGFGEVIYDSHTDLEWETTSSPKDVTATPGSFTSFTYDREMFRVSTSDVFFRFRFKNSSPCNLGDGSGGTTAPVLQISVRDFVSETVATREAMFGTAKDVKPLGSVIGWMEGDRMAEHDATTSVHAEQTIKAEHHTIGTDGLWASGTIGNITLDEIRTRRPDSNTAVEWSPMTLDTSVVDSNAKVTPFLIGAGQSALITSVAFQVRQGYNTMTPQYLRILDADNNNSVLFDYVMLATVTGNAATYSDGDWVSFSISNPPYLDAGSSVYFEIYTYNGGVPFQVTGDTNGNPYFKFLTIPYHWATLQYAEDSTDTSPNVWMTGATPVSGNYVPVMGTGNKAHEVASFSLENTNAPTIHLEWGLGGDDVPEIEGTSVTNIVRNGSLYTGDVTLPDATWSTDDDLTITLGSIDTVIPHVSLSQPVIDTVELGVYPTTSWSAQQTALKVGDTIDLTIDSADDTADNSYKTVRITGDAFDEQTFTVSPTVVSGKYQTSVTVTCKSTITTTAQETYMVEIQNDADTWSTVFNSTDNPNCNNTVPGWASDPVAEYPGTQTALKGVEEVNINMGAINNPSDEVQGFTLDDTTSLMNSSNSAGDYQLVRISTGITNGTVPITMWIRRNDNGGLFEFPMTVAILDEATTWNGVVSSYRKKATPAPENIVLGTNNPITYPVQPTITVANTAVLSNGNTTELTDNELTATVLVENAAGRQDTITYQYKTKGFEPHTFVVPDPLVEITLANYDLAIVTDTNVTVDAIATVSNGSTVPVMVNMKTALADVATSADWYNDDNVIKTSVTGNGSIYHKGYGGGASHIDVTIEESV